MARATTEVDALIGARVRKRRREKGLSQVALAQKLGVTFQQVQKYETGTNRISAASLYEISKLLGVPMSFFFKETQAPA
jgi:transcriptional regulator with XRE-family HTH domain